MNPSQNIFPSLKIPSVVFQANCLKFMLIACCNSLYLLIQECINEEKKDGDAAGDGVAKTELTEEKKASDGVVKTEQNEEQNSTAKQTSETISSTDLSNKDKLPKVEEKPKGMHGSIDKELLKAGH